jgi:hypothetical protein
MILRSIVLIIFSVASGLLLRTDHWVLAIVAFLPIILMALGALSWEPRDNDLWMLKIERTQMVIKWFPVGVVPTARSFEFFGYFDESSTQIVKISRNIFGFRDIYKLATFHIINKIT